MRPHFYTSPFKTIGLILPSPIILFSQPAPVPFIQRTSADAPRAFLHLHIVEPRSFALANLRFFVSLVLSSFTYRPLECPIKSPGCRLTSPRLSASFRALRKNIFRSPLLLLVPPRSEAFPLSAGLPCFSFRHLDGPDLNFSIPTRSLN